jgi:hypothetical protein
MSGSGVSGGVVECREFWCDTGIPRLAKFSRLAVNKFNSCAVLEGE